MDTAELIELIKQAAIDVISHSQTQIPPKPFFSSGDWVALFSVFMAFVFGIVNSAVSLRKLKIETITNNRMSWVNSVRMLCSDILSCYAYEISINNSGTIEFLFCTKMNDRINQLKLYLNFESDYDRKIINILDDLKKLLHVILETRRLYSHKEMCIDCRKSQDEIADSLSKFLSRRERLSYREWILEHDLLDYLLNFNPQSLYDDLVTTVDEDKGVVMSGTGDTDLFDLLMEEFNALKQDLGMYMQFYLKSEWTRVKQESKVIQLCKYNEKKVLDKYVSKQCKDSKRLSLSEQLEILKINND